jgi:hypothetical protein
MWLRPGPAASGNRGRRLMAKVEAAFFIVIAVLAQLLVAAPVVAA